MSFLGRVISPVLSERKRGLGAAPPSSRVLPYPAATISESSGGRTVVKVGYGGSLDTQLAICFPKYFYDLSRMYLQQMSQVGKPSTVEGQLYHALNMWANINYCLFALNIPFAGVNGVHGVKIKSRHPNPMDGLSGVVGDVSQITDDFQPMQRPSVLTPFYEDIARFYKTALRTRESNIQAARYDFKSSTWEEEARAAPIMPGPFMSLVPMWFGVIRRGLYAYPKYHNGRLQKIALSDILPWMAGGMRVPSYGSKDGGEDARAARDPKFAHARMQWRMWSLRDYYQWGKDSEWQDDIGLTGLKVDKGFYPENMGKVTDTSTLGTYMAKLSSMSTSPELSLSGRGWEPNLAWVIDHGLGPMARRLFSMDYEATVRDHVEQWFDHTKPDLDPATGKLRIIQQGAGSSITSQVAITYEDMADIKAAKQDALKARAHDDLENFERKCMEDAGGNEAMEQMCSMSASVEGMIEEMPVMGQIYDIAKVMFHGLIELVGMAEGWSYKPYVLINAPFIRSALTSGYSTVPAGSSATVLARMLTAINNITIRMDIGISPWVPKPSRPQKVEGVVVMDADGNPVFKAATPESDCRKWLGIALSLKPVTLTEREKNIILLTCVNETNGKAAKGAALAVFNEVADRKGGVLFVTCDNYVDNALREFGVTLPDEKRAELLYYCGMEKQGKLPAGQTAKAIRNMAVPQITLVAAAPKKGIGWVWLAAAGVGAGALVLSRRR